MKNKMTMVTVLNEKYTFNHGRSPRGRGTWAFHPDFNVDCSSPEILWTPSMTFSEAKKLAKAHFAGKAAYVETLS